MKKLIYITMIFSLLFTACGNRKSPTGGPADTEKPTVLSVSPNNFEQIENKQISITFSKPIDQTSVLSGIQFYPPVLNKRYSWKNNTLTIRIDENLKNNTNYFMTLTPFIKCYHGNAFEIPITYVFKNGQLNEFKISGMLEYEKETDKNTIKKLLILDKDSLLVLEKTYEGSNWLVENLNDQLYIVRSFLDKNKNNKYDFGTEPYCEIKTEKNTRFPVKMNFAYADTTKPVIKSITTESNNQIVLNFNKELSYKPFVMIVGDKNQSMLKILHNELKGERLFLITEPQDTIKYSVKIRTLYDKKGNSTEELNTYMNGSEKKDKESPRIISSSLRNGATISQTRPELEITFSEIMLKEDVIFSCFENESQKKIPFSAIKTNSSVWKFKSEAELTPFNSYTFTISNASEDPNNNKLDNDFILQFIVIKK